MDALYWATACISSVAVVLNIHGSPVCFVLWTCTNAIWVYADATHGLYSQAVLQGVYLVLAVYGLVRWTRRGLRAERETSDATSNSS